LIKIKYSPDLYTEPKATLFIDGERVRKDEAAARIQTKFGTQYRLFGTQKAVNRATNDVFQDWARDNLPRDYVRIDLDAILNTQNHIPAVLIEVKRSTQDPPERWQPYVKDIRNYYIVDLLAKTAHLKFITLNHAHKNVILSDNSTIGIHDIQKVSLAPQEIQSSKELAKAKDVVAYLTKLIS